MKHLKNYDIGWDNHDSLIQLQCDVACCEEVSSQNSVISFVQTSISFLW